jgi:hypothetical protein
MSFSPHLRAAIWITAGATLFVVLVVTRLVGSMMADPYFGRGDNPFELISLLACVVGPLLALASAAGLALGYAWALKIARLAAGVLFLGALTILGNFAIAGNAETGQTSALVTAQTAAGLGSAAGAIGLLLLTRWLKFNEPRP